MDQYKNEGLEVVSVAEGSATPIERSRRKLLVAGASATPVLLSLSSKSALASGMCQPPSRVMSGNMSAVGQTTYYCGGHPPSHYKKCSGGKTVNWPIGVKQACVQKWNGSGWSDHSGDVGDGFLGCDRSKFNYIVSSGKPPSGSFRIKRNNNYDNETSFEFGAKMSDCFPGLVGWMHCYDPSKQINQSPSGTYHPKSVFETLCFQGSLDTLTWEFLQECIAAYFNCLNPLVGTNSPITAAQVRDMCVNGLMDNYRPLGTGGGVWSKRNCKDYLQSIRGNV